MNFFETFISDDAIQLVNDCMKTERLSAGKMADRFEADLTNILKVENPITVNSGTSALHLALVLAEVGPGDEVLLPAQTFIATGLAIKYVGATPVFCDINPSTGNIDADDAETRIVTGKTKAIMCVDWAGYPCDLSYLKHIANEHNLILIEDAAHSIGATYCGMPIGNVADFTCFSFQAIKHLTTGDGGAVCCHNPEDAIKARNLRWFDIDRDNSKSDLLGERVYDAQHIGFKYHMNDLAASMGVGNLPYLRGNLDIVGDIADRYNDAFKDNPDIRLMEYMRDRPSTYWLYPMIVNRREQFIEKLKSKGIPTSVVHLGIDKNTILGGKNSDLKGQRFFDEHQIHIPINYKLTTDEVSYIIDTINKGW